MHRIAVFRSNALHLSETFIATQLNAMTHFDPVFFYVDRVNADIFPFKSLHQVIRREGLAGRAERWRLALGLGTPGFEQGIQVHRPVAIHAHGGEEGAKVVRIAQRHGLPLITTFHGRDATAQLTPRLFRHRVLYWMQQRNMNALKKHGSLVIAVSKEVRHHLLAQGFSSEKVRVIHLGIDLGHFDSIRSQAPSRTPNIITIGRLVEKKGTTDLVKAFAKIAGSLDTHRLDIIGDGPLRGEVEELIDSLNIGNRVTLHGALPFTEAHALLAKSQIFCLPSKQGSDGDKEGLPIAILEAMALGTPVVSTWHSGIPEAVEDGESGLLLQEGDVDGLSDALLKVATSEPLRNTLAQNARVRVEQDFNTKTQTAILEREIERIIKE